MSVIKNKAKFINEIASKISPEVSIEAIKRDLNRLNFSTIKSLRYFLDSIVGYKYVEKLEEVNKKESPDQMAQRLAEEYYGLPKKIQAIKEIRATFLDQGFGLKEAKDLIDKYWKY